MPHEFNAKFERNVTTDADVRYRSFAEVKADLKAAGYSDEKIEMLVEDLRPKMVSVANPGPKVMPVKTPASANGGAGQGDYLDEDGTLRNAKGEPITTELRK